MVYHPRRCYLLGVMMSLSIPFVRGFGRSVVQSVCRGRSCTSWTARLPHSRRSLHSNSEKPTASAVTSDSTGYDYHVPVMKDECMKYLAIQPDGLYIDCTMGGGGHTQAILEQGGRVLALDQDPDAIKAASTLLQSYIDSGRLEIQQTNFRNVKRALARSTLAKQHTATGLADGVLMDLGISSYQINAASRGFAFSLTGPLDMRMHKGSIAADGQSTSSTYTAKTIVNEWNTEDLADLLYNYGDETRSRVIAREIVASRPLQTTADLEKAISKVVSFKDRPKCLARCFQALRIEVNDEMNALEDALCDVQDCVRIGGRLVVLSYHSLEDRRVKQLIRTGTLPTSAVIASSTQPQRQRIATQDTSNAWHAVVRRSMPPSDEEVSRNSRARSAKLRVAERVTPDNGLASAQGVTQTMGAKQLRKLQKQQQQQQQQQQQLEKQ